MVYINTAQMPEETAGINSLLDNKLIQSLNSCLISHSFLFAEILKEGANHRFNGNLKF